MCIRDRYRAAEEVTDIGAYIGTDQTEGQLLDQPSENTSRGETTEVSDDFADTAHHAQDGSQEKPGAQGSRIEEPEGLPSDQMCIRDRYLPCQDRPGRSAGTDL